MTTTHPRDRTALLVPEFKRLSYFYGQHLGPFDLQGEQAYLREKHRLANRFLHGWGVVCGLEVVPVPAAPKNQPEPGQTAHPEQSDPGKTATEQAVSQQGPTGASAPSARRKRQQPASEQPPSEPSAPPASESAPEPSKQAEPYDKDPYGKRPPGPCVAVWPGLALDCHGDELVLRQPVVLDLWRELSPDDQKRVLSGNNTVWLSICTCEQPVDSARPMYTDACGIPGDCSYARIRETVALRVTTRPPERPDRCACCPGDCPDPCVVLARIDDVAPGHALEAAQIHNGVRQMLTRHRLTTITGISFVHGATYTRDVATELLIKGFEVRFSDPVRVNTLTEEVVDIIVYQGGGGQRDSTYPKPGRYHQFTASDYTDRFVYRQRGDERLEHGDRVVIQVKADFILDECCRAVDGNHLGGRVPLLPGYDKYAANRPPGCDVPPDRPGPWVSGNGTQGGTFETWFLVEKRERGHDDDKRY
jgi:hypothetical protein